LGPPHSQKINWAVASTAEYKPFGGLAKQIEEFNHPPFIVARNGDTVTKEKATRTQLRRRRRKKRFHHHAIQGLGAK